ncbi:MAG TPA: TonB-dependent receptor [Salinimicrobium sp.]|nr:TonB-dependent receptor [Salinimicrobium sp.]
MKQTIFFLIFFCTIITADKAYTQEKFTISGTVKEASSNETVIGVNVIIPELQTGTVTNEYGFYSITIPEGNYDVTFSLLGFQSVTHNFEVDKDIKFNLSMEESTEMLDDVIITDDVERLDIDNPQMSVNALKIGTIKKMPVVLGETDVIKSILLLPGVTSGGEGAAGFNVRGGAADQNLILLDEATLYNSSHLFGFFSVFNPDAIKDLKLYKGGIPARYGGRISSVLDIYQKDGNRNKFEAMGGIGLVSSRLLIEGPIVKEKGSFLAGGRSSYAHLFLPLFDNDNIAYFYDLNTKFSYSLNDNNNLFLSGYFGRDVFEIMDNFNNSFGNTTLNLRWNHLFSNKLFSNLSAIYTDYYYGLELGFVGFEYVSGIQNFNLKYDLKHYLSDKLQLNYGFNSIYYSFNPGEITPTTEESGINALKLTNKFSWENAIYVDAEIEFKKLAIQAGLRLSSFNRLGQTELNIYENNNPVNYNHELKIYEKAIPIGTESFSRSETIKAFINLEPRLSVAYRLNEDASLKASYNRMSQYIHLISNTSSPTPFDVYAPSGKFIEPQLADQVAIGYSRNLNLFSLEVESFYKKIQNRLDYIDGADLIGNNAIERVVLSGEARAYGLEVLLKKNKGDLQGWFAYTLSKSEQRTSGRNAEEIGINNGKWYNTAWDKTHDIAITASYDLDEKWDFGASFIFQTGQPATFPNGKYVYNGMVIPSFEERNSSRLQSFHHLDISATLTPSKNKERRWQGEWVFSIYNVYNRMNAASITFRENEDRTRNEAVRLSIFGIIPAITYNFKF